MTTNLDDAALAEASGPAADDASCAAGRTRRDCAWCARQIPTRARRDALCCSVRCRQARHRFTRATGHAHTSGGAGEGGRALRLAYADPPYPGNARLYRAHRDYAGEVDHTKLIARLGGYDGWALSTSAVALPTVLALCPPEVRVAAWHRGERPTTSRRPLNGWEPVIYHGGRHLATGGAGRRVDSLVHGVTAITTLPTRVIGAKPATFCRWVFTLLGAQPGDQLDDLFPGSGAVARAWSTYTDPSRQAPCDDYPDPSSAAGPDASAPQASCSPANTTPHPDHIGQLIITHTEEAPA